MSAHRLTHIVAHRLCAHFRRVRTIIVLLTASLLVIPGTPFRTIGARSDEATACQPPVEQNLSPATVARLQHLRRQQFRRQESRDQEEFERWQFERRDRRTSSGSSRGGSIFGYGTPQSGGTTAAESQQWEWPSDQGPEWEIPGEGELASAYDPDWELLEELAAEFGTDAVYTAYFGLPDEEPAGGASSESNTLWHNSSWERLHDVTQLPMTADGWTDLTALYQHPDLYLDSRIVFVSSSAGNDATAVVYQSGDGELGNDPFRVATGVQPFATISAAYQQMRDGFPDIMLLRRGDVWTNDPFLEITRSGRSALEPAIIGAYGTDGDLPIRRTSYNAFFAREDNGSQNHVIIADQHCEPVSRSTTTSGPTGVSWEGSTSGLLIEGCRFLAYRNNLTLQSSEAIGSPVVDNITVRRNIIADAWSSAAHSQGIYTYDILNCLIEENVFDLNGWNPSVEGAHATIFNRSLYLAASPLMIVRGNIDARGSSGGMQLRSGGISEGNLSLQNPLAIDLGHAQTGAPFGGSVRNNVILDSRDIESSPRGFGVGVGHGAVDVEVADNIIAHQRSGTGNIVAIWTTHERKNYFGDLSVVTGTEIASNIVYRWDLNGQPTGQALRIGQATVGINVHHNVFWQPSGASLITYLPGTMHNGPNPTWHFSDNLYSAGESVTPFAADSTAMSFPTWQSHVNEFDTNYAAPVFPDPERDIDSYAMSLGLLADDYEQALNAFLMEARQQSRYYWRPEYSANAAVNYIRAGFGKPAVPIPY